MMNISENSIEFKHARQLALAELGKQLTEEGYGGFGADSVPAVVAELGGNTYELIDDIAALTPMFTSSMTQEERNLKALEIVNKIYSRIEEAAELNFPNEVDSLTSEKLGNY